MRAAAEAWDTFLLAFVNWRARIVIAVLAVVFALGYVGSGQVFAARTIALGLPILATLSALAARRNGGAGAGAALVIAFGIFFATEQLTAHTFFEPTPWGAATLSDERREVEVVVPSGDFELETQGQVPESSSSAQGKYVLQLTRGQTTISASGEFSRTAQQVSRRRRMPAAIAGHVYDTERQLIELPGSGPVKIKLDTLEGSIGKSLEVRVLPPPIGGHWVILLLYPLLLGAVLIDSLSSTRKFPGFAGWLCAAGVFTLRASERYTSHDPMAAIIASLFIAIAATFAAFFASWIMSRFTTGLIRKPAEAK